MLLGVTILLLMCSPSSRGLPAAHFREALDQAGGSALPAAHWLAAHPWRYVTLPWRIM